MTTRDFPRFATHIGISKGSNPPMSVATSVATSVGVGVGVCNGQTGPKRMTWIRPRHEKRIPLPNYLALASRVKEYVSG
jgi:hypothetical protein